MSRARFRRLFRRAPGRSSGRSSMPPTAASNRSWIIRKSNRKREDPCMASAQHREVLSVNRDRIFDTITNYEDYPNFVDGCTRVSVERGGVDADAAAKEMRVTYEVSLMRD